MAAYGYGQPPRTLRLEYITILRNQIINSHKSFQLSVGVIAISFSSFFLPLANAEEIAFYVSTEGNDKWAGNSISKPFATIQKARDVIREIKKQGGLTKPVTVYIRGGLYELSETLVFAPEDSGTESFPITYAAYKDEKPVISGGRKITGTWQDYKGKIKVCTIPQIKEGKWNFRQLFVDDKRQIRARIPNDSYYKIEEPLDEPTGKKAFKFREGDFKNWHCLNDVEVIIFHSSNESRLLISELSEEERVVVFSGPIGGALVKGRHRNRYYVENVLEGLDQPGEWYLDKHTGKLYYWPVDTSQVLQLRAPVLNQIIRFEGNEEEEEYVQYINFVGLTFSDAAYMLPEEGIPTLSEMGDIYRPSAITLEGARFCIFRNNCVRNVGTYALEVTGDGIQIVGNEIYDAGSGGIITRSYGKHRNVISYNHIHHCGAVFHGAVGINADDGRGSISHNLIHDISQSGIYTHHQTTDFHESGRNNQQQDLIIEYNEIYDVMQMMNDGAGIFVHGSNVMIRNNVIHDVYSYGKGASGWGIRLGFETRDSRLENNLVYKTREGLHIWHGNGNISIENNIFVDSEWCLVNISNPKDRRHENVKFRRNIFYYTRTDVDLFKIGGERSLPVESDYNVLWNPAGCIWLSPVIWGMRGIAYFEDWQKQGFDTHSIVKDPLFADKANDDYSLKSNSPAFKVGFKPIDISKVGLRGR